MVRTFVCLWLFGVGAEALGGGAFGVVVSGAVALYVNKLWHDQKREELQTRHRKQVEADERLRLWVRRQQSKP